MQHKVEKLITNAIRLKSVMKTSMPNLVNGCDIPNSSAREARHISNVVPILFPTTTKGTTVE